MSDKLFHLGGKIAVGCLLLTAGLAWAETQGTLSDPTRPRGWQVAAAAPVVGGQRAVDALRLQGTFSVGGEKSALLSGQRVLVGDEVAGATVIEINNNKVILRVDGETVELASMMPSVKSPTPGEGDQR